MRVDSKRILIADKDMALCRILKERLKILGYNVLFAHDGLDVLVKMAQEQIDLIIIDIMLPKLDGYEVCLEIRKESNIPIIMLGASDNIRDRIIGLEIGADDFLIKPFSKNELEARVKSSLRRSKNRNDIKTLIEIDNLVIDIFNKRVFKNNSLIKLTIIEFNILELLIVKAGEQVSRNYILFNIWGYHSERQVDTRVVDVYISRLRAKLEHDSRRPNFIITKRGVGYMFQAFQKNIR